MLWANMSLKDLNPLPLEIFHLIAINSIEGIGNNLKNISLFESKNKLFGLGFTGIVIYMLVSSGPNLCHFVVGILARLKVSIWGE